MLEERYALEKLIEGCKSIGELDSKIANFENDSIEFFVDSKDENSTILIGVKRYKSQLSTIVDNDGKIKPTIVTVDEPWAWYSFIPPKGFIFKW